MNTTATATATKERPILFSGPMVRAILEGRKTQTRRVLKVGKQLPEFIGYPGDENDPYMWHFEGYGIGADGEEPLTVEWLSDRKGSRKYGKPGELLWVREAWGTATVVRLDSDDVQQRTVYRADFPDDYDGFGVRWQPSIHLPRHLSRITLRITDVRVQRVQDITEEDARAEGVDDTCPGDGKLHPPTPECHLWSARNSFAVLWDSINGKREGCSWAANPWVWCLSFERVEGGTP